ncbi:calcium-binding and coiled-coil domain-containing protein 1-like [Cloeon dipterum]|uniref:calcium-binding and coiled-coil domain-containing protein 1-like n=1 Tax=Cloeon dipterum TaxID=197152 RepID=UPI00321FB758
MALDEMRVLLNSASQAYKDVLAENTQLRGHVDDLEEQIKSLVSECQDLKNRLKAILEETRDKIETIQSKASSEAIGNAQEIAELKTNLREVEHQAQKKVREDSIAKKQLVKELETTKKDLSAVQSQLKSLKEENGVLKKKANEGEAAKKSVGVLNAKLTKSVTVAKKSSAIIDDLQRALERCNDLEKRLNQKDKELYSTKNRLMTLEKQLSLDQRGALNMLELTDLTTAIMNGGDQAQGNGEKNEIAKNPRNQ